VVDQSTQRIQSFRTTPDGGQPSPTHAAHGAARGEGFDPHRASTGELVSQAAGQITTLVRSEMALAKAEAVEKGKKLGLGGAMLATAGLFGLFSFGLVIALIVAVLDIDWPLWLAVLVPLLALGVLTLGLAGFGISRLRAGASAPAAANSVRDDIESMKHAFRDGRSNNHAWHEGRHGS
jgi:Putative Actinobacterial Holin-X, holin superfamily III